MNDHGEPMLPAEEQPYVVDQPTERRDDVAYIIIVEDRVAGWANDVVAMTGVFPDIFGRDPEELWLNPVWYRRAVTAWRSGSKGSARVEVDLHAPEVRVADTAVRLRVVEDARIPEGELHVVAPPPAAVWEIPS